MPCSCDRRGMWDRRVSIGQTSNANSGLSILEPLMELIIEHCTGKYNHSIRNMMNEVDIENLTIEQYLMLIQENLAHGMARTKSDRMITKDIENITIGEYMEYEAEIKRDPWGYAQSYTRSSGSTTLERSKENKHHLNKLKTNAYFPLFPPCFKPTQPLTKDTHEPVEKDPNDFNLSEPNSHHEDEEVSFDEDVDEWLNAEMSKRMTGFTLPCTIGNLKLHNMADLGAGVNVMPKSLFEHLKLAHLKETSMVVEMTNITKKAPLGIMENILVKIDKFLFHSDFVVIDMLEGLNETMLLGRPFLATIYAQIDVFRREISKAKNFNPLEIENDVFSYDSPACLLLEQGTPSCSEESIDSVVSSHDMQELEGSQDVEVGSHLLENVVSRWHVCKPICITFIDCEKDCGQWPTCNPDLSFCSGYDAIYGQEESGMLKQWICFRDHER
ncbi:copia protein [Tanacetum coccineum]